MSVSTANPTIVKRDGSTTEFNVDKISAAISKAMVEAHPDRSSEEISTHSKSIASAASMKFMDKERIGVEEIQDIVESTLLLLDEKTAKKYIAYRENRARSRSAEETLKRFTVVKSDGSTAQFDPDRLKAAVLAACKDIVDVSAQALFAEAERQLHDGIHSSQIWGAMIKAATSYIDIEPNYAKVASRMTLQQTADEVFAQFGKRHVAGAPVDYSYFRTMIELGVQQELYSPELLSYDFNKLVAAIDTVRDDLFEFMGMDMICNKYLMRTRNGKRLELPQSMLMRVAMGVCLNEPENVRVERAIELYNVYSNHFALSSTPTLFNSGTPMSQMSSCYLNTVGDSLEQISKAWGDAGQMSKYSGGQAFDWTYVRGAGAYIRGTNGHSRGGPYWWKVMDGVTAAVSQGSRREGAIVNYLENWHTDTIGFAQFRKTTGDESVTGKWSNTAFWISDLFMERMIENKPWWFFDPSYASSLHDLYGSEFVKEYERLEKLVVEGECETDANGNKKAARSNPCYPARSVKAYELGREMIKNLFETGHPWWTFKDTCNYRSPQRHCGVVHSSNLCTEITLNTKASTLKKDGTIDELGETAVCNLASIVLPKFIKDGKLDVVALEKVIRVMVRALDNVIDLNYYPIPEARNANMKHRPIGLGVMGFHDALLAMGIAYDSPEAVEFSDISFEVISMLAIKASCDLARERGKYPTYEGSDWSRGIFPIDTVQVVRTYRGKYFAQDTGSRQDWTPLRADVAKYGMRNSLVLAVAPTASIGNLMAASNGIDPHTYMLYVKGNLSGEYVVLNRYLVDELKAIKKWDEHTAALIKRDGGSVQHLDIPQDIKARYKTAHEMHPKWLIECASRRQKWIDQSQSFNVFASPTEGSDLVELYILAWMKGLKTTYYLKAKSASAIEASSLPAHLQRKIEDMIPKPHEQQKACRLEDPSCEACQ